MKTRLRTILLLLLAGAASTVAVAWACAAWVPVGIRAERYGADGIEGYSRVGDWEMWIVQRNDRFGVTLIKSDYLVNASGSFLLSDIPAAQVVPPWVNRQIEHGESTERLRFFTTGWPLRALGCRVDLTGPNEETQLAGGFRLPERAALPRVLTRVPALPYRPIWLGFALDTLLYAAVLGLLFAAASTARQAYRARRGRCWKCGYPIGAPQACSECGALVRAVSE